MRLNSKRSCGLSLPRVSGLRTFMKADNAKDVITERLKEFEEETSEDKRVNFFSLNSQNYYSTEPTKFFYFS